MATVDRDRNLLFGIFAAQLRGVRPERIIEVGAAWATDPSRSLAERMVTLGLLTEADRKFLEALVEGAVQAHGGDSALALKTLGGEAQIEQTFSGTLRLTPSGQVEMVEREGQAAVPGGARELNIPEETPGRYSRISVYGKGGMGRVLLVHDENMDRDVAMKELLPHPPDVREPWTPVGHTAAMVARFLREARLTGLLEHPSIVPVYELGRRADGSLYYTMKLVRGKTFLQAIRDGKGLAQRLTLLPHFLNLCHAIAYAHSRGVIHRDLKPANVMVGDFGETVVLDWGIAKAQGTQDPHETELTEALTALRLGEQEFTIHTEAGEALGTPHYMPPEQAQGRINEIDKRSDVYSLGAVLYEMLTAKTPHSGKTTKEIIEHVVREPVRPVLELEQDAPAELAGICDKCLDKDPAHRYQSARELADEIERFLSGALVRSYKYNLGQLLRHYYRRHRAVLNTALAGAAALLLLAVYSYVSITRAYHREQEQRQIAEIAREKETEAKEAAIVARDEEEKAKDSAERQLYIASILLARQSIEGQRYDVAMEALDRAPAAHRNWEWGYYNRLCHLDEHTLAGHEGPVVSAEYSPDGTLLVTASDDHTARLWSSDGSERAVLRGHTGQLRVATFSPAGHRVATASEDGLAILWDSATGKEIVRLKGHDGGVNAVEFSPTGEAALTASADGTARLWNASTGEEQGRLQGHSTNVRLARFNPEGTRIVTASQDGTARLWDAASGQEIIVLGAGSSFRGARFSNDGQRLLLWANTPPKAFLFNGLTGESQKVIEDLGGRPCSGGFSPDNLRFAVGCIDGHVSVYSAADAMPLLDWSTDH
ncbi:MAG: serine/threonine protein kinase, partial [Candidatus Hydrogenedentes bacterium]|nr:serine/threonine protein kinase [Candidatus Hydrogenedentota bacterium]